MIRPGPLRRDGGPVLGIPTGIPAGGLAATRLSALRGEPGWIVGPRGVQPWALGGMEELEGEVVLVGPWEEGGTSLEQALETGAGGTPAGRALPALERVAEALQRLRGLDRLPPDLQPESVFLLPGERVLFLPPALMQQVRRTRQTPPLHAAGLRGEASLSFALGVLLYRLVTGTDPFAGGAEEEVRDRMRNATLPPPSLAVPEVRPEVGAAILAALGREARDGRPRRPFPGALPGLDEWRERLGAWGREGLFRELEPGRRQRLERAGRKAQRRAGEAFRRQVFRRRHGRAVLLAAAAALLVGAGLASWLGGLLAPRLTRGWPPARVVESYYRSFGALDLDTLQGCLARGAGRQDVDELTRLVVVSRVAQAYEGRSHLVSAEEWARSGRPALPPPAAVYGVLDLRLEAVEGGAGPAFVAEYEKWVPVPQEDGAPAYAGRRVRDRLELGLSRGGWAIERLERLELGPPGG